MSKSCRQQQRTKKKSSYRLKNWPEYNTALKKRGSITLWFSDEALAHWRHRGPLQRGTQFHYSDLAIQTGLTMKAIYHLGFRQTEGFLQSVAKLLVITIDIPDYSTLSRRQKTLAVPLATSPSREPVHVVVDSTGVKVFGEGEWKVRQHGVSKRRTWRWQEQSGYHRRSLAENFMFRYKTIIGPQFQSRTFEAQQIETRIGCMILNRMTALGMPDSCKKV